MAKSPEQETVQKTPEAKSPEQETVQKTPEAKSPEQETVQKTPEAKSPEQETVSGEKTRKVKVKLLAKAYINRRLYEVGETAQITWPVGEDLPKHLQEVKEKKED